MNSHRISFLHTRIGVAWCLAMWLFGNAGCHKSANGSSPDAAIDAPDIDAPAIDGGACPASCDDNNTCTTDSCNPVSHQCVHVALSDGTLCEDGSTCTINDICHGGLCYSGPFKTCKTLDQCHVAGSCSPATGECTNPNANNRTGCDDGKKCTQGDQCMEGVCTGTPLACPDGYACDETVGSCVGVAADGGTVDGGISYAFPTATSGLVLENLNWASSGSAAVRTGEGRVFAGGYFAGKADLGVGVMDTGDVGDSDLFLVEFDMSTGKALWSQSYSGPQNQTASSVAVNGNAQIALLGALEGSLTVGTTEIIAKTTADNYVLGASTTDGTGMWVRRFTMRANAGSGRGSLNSIAAGPKGSSFAVCGSADKAATDVSPDLVAQGGVDAVLASLDGTTGQTLWAIQFGGVNDENCNFVAMDSESNIYVVGTYLYGSTVSIGGLPPLPVVDQTKNTTWLFIAKLDPTGKGIWSQSIGNPGKSNSFKATAIWPISDGLVIAGLVPISGTIAGVALDQSSPIFLAKLAADSGQIDWVVPLATTQGGGGDAVTVLSSNSKDALIVAGKYANSIAFDKYTLPVTSKSGAFVAQVNGTTGQLIGAKGYGGATEADSLVGIVTNLNGLGSEKDTSFFLGQFVGKIDLGLPVGVLTADPAATIPSTFVAKVVP